MRFFSRPDASAANLTHYYAIVGGGKVVGSPHVMMHFMIDNETGLMYLTQGIVTVVTYDKGQYGTWFAIPATSVRKVSWLTEIPGELFLKVMLESKIHNETGITDADNQGTP